MLTRVLLTPDLAQWTAALNGQALHWLTDAGTTLTERGIATDRMQGVELVNERGEIVARSVGLWR